MYEMQVRKGFTTDGVNLPRCKENAEIARVTMPKRCIREAPSVPSLVNQSKAMSCEALGSSFLEVKEEPLSSDAGQETKTPEKH